MFETLVESALEHFAEFPCVGERRVSMTSVIHGGRVVTPVDSSALQQSGAVTGIHRCLEKLNVNEVVKAVKLLMHNIYYSRNT